MCIITMKHPAKPTKKYMNSLTSQKISISLRWMLVVNGLAVVLEVHAV